MRLIVPGTAGLTRHPLLDFRIDRRFEERHGGLERRVPGKRLKQISKRPTYVDLPTHPVDVPAGFAPSPPVKLVLGGSVAEEPCPDCAAGKRDCDACGGSGTQDCPKRVKCAGCGGGADACWSCGGTRNRGSRKPPANARTQARTRTDWCRRCGAHDMACPQCFGRQTMTCRVCEGKGHRPCDACGGSKRVRHKPCAGTGFFTTFVEAVITHPVQSDQERVPTPAHLWWPTRRAGWRRESLSNATDKLPADLPDTLRTQVEPQLARAKREVARRATLHFLPVARVMVVGDQEWVYFAFPERPETGGTLKVVRRPAKQRVVRLAGIAATAVVIAVLVAWLAVRAVG
ncbi:hypothetical protein ACFYXF_10185 [Streptomyces sp. NPDC002680]|uniref:hypothetical protein n=1 Tax=Streptomyces sp. NPDC002680 TaxID=3364659 RepID=UPI0036D0A9BD